MPVSQLFVDRQFRPRLLSDCPRPGFIPGRFVGGDLVSIERDQFGGLLLTICHLGGDVLR